MTDSQKWWILTLVATLGWLLYVLAPILMPFAMAAILAYLGDPLVDRLELVRIRNWRLNRTTGVVIVFLGISLIAVSILLIVIPTIEYQVGRFIDNLPSYSRWLNQSVIPILQEYFGKGIRPLEIDQLIAFIRRYWQENTALTGNVIRSVSHSGVLIIGWLMNLVLIPVITFYLLRDWDRLVAKIHDLIPRRNAATVSKLAGEADAVLGAFLRGQFYVMLALGLIYSTGLFLVGLDLALLIGMVAGLISFVPYLGSIVGIAMACIAAALQFQDVIHLLLALLVFVVGQSLESMLLTPWLVGNRIGLHPVAVIFAVLAGGQLFGFLGILLALPVASVIMVLLRHMHECYTGSGFYSGSGAES